MNDPPDSSNALATHTLLDYHGCNPDVLACADTLRPLALEAVRSAGGTIVTDIFHGFSPHGVSGVIVIAESHVAIHTWPEHGFAAVDVFSCSPKLDQEVIALSFTRALQSQSVTRRIEPRGP